MGFVVEATSRSSNSSRDQVFSPLLIVVKASSLEICIDYNPKSEHVVCA